MGPPEKRETKDLDELSCEFLVIDIFHRQLKASDYLDHEWGLGRGQNFLVNMCVN